MTLKELVRQGYQYYGNDDGSVTLYVEIQSDYHGIKYDGREVRKLLDKLKRTEE